MADLTKVGEYWILQGDNHIKFWPVGPEVTVESFEWSPEVSLLAPHEKNKLTVLPDFGIFDILVELSSDGVIEENVDSAEVYPLRFERMAGKPSQRKMPLFLEHEHMAPISFAVPIPKNKDSFEGTLMLEVTRADDNKAVRAQLKIKVERHKRVADMYVFFVVHKKFAGNKYCWFKSKVVQKADNTPVSGVPVTLKVLRDNLEKAGVAVNRRVTLVSNSEGYLSRDDTRTVIGVVTKWPLIANAFWGSFVSQEYLNRGNLYRFKREDVDNLAPVEPPLDIRLIKKADADMAGKRVLVDPGHGVAYALTSDRRSQEWFVVHQIGRRVIDILTREFNCHAANILFTRSAGFGLIEPDLKLKFRGADKAADAGDKRFEFKRKERLIRAKLNTVTLKEISDLLLTTHDDDNKPQDIAASDRIRLLTKNQKDDDTGAIDKIEDRLNTKLKKTGLCVQEDSVRWDDDEQQYVYTEERIAPKKGQDKIARLMAPLPISISDWFLIDDDMLRVLYARSARWSLAHEIGSGPTEGAGGTDCKEWIPYVREVMKSAGAVSYMETACAAELDIDTAIGPASSRAWSPTYRRNYFNKQACDLYISIHLNAAFNAKKPQQYTGKAKGCACEVVKPADQDQTRLSKVFIKYLDPYDHGLRQGGIPVPDKAVGLLNPDENDRIGQYVFLEIEFMDSLIPPDLQEFRYQEMVSGLFVEAVAQQIVSGIVEYFFDQAGLVQMDDVIYDGKLGVW